MKQLKITLVKSPIGILKNQKATLKALGLGKVGSSSLRVDNKEVRAMIKTVAHLVSVVEGVRPGYEGGQTPLFKRLPKRGFTNVSHKEYAIVNLGEIEKEFEAGSVVDLASLKAAGLVKKEYEGVKILGEGELTKALTFKVVKVTKSAQEKISKAGGTVEVA